MTPPAPTSPLPSSPLPSPRTLLPPTLSSTFPDFEFSIHRCPRRLHRDLPSIFPDLLPISSLPSVLLIPALQRSSVDLLSYGPVQAAEKDRLLARFLRWADLVRRAVALRDPAAWLDVTDPASAVAHFGTPAASYSDVDGLVTLRRFRTIDCAGCTVAAHPQWRYAMYPGPFPTHSDLYPRACAPRFFTQLAHRFFRACLLLFVLAYEKPPCSLPPVRM